jgi:hypothetical protein
VAHELECIAYILSRKNEHQRAVTILGAADSLRRLIGSTATPVELAEYEKELETLRGKISGGELERGWGEGQMLSMDEAIMLAKSA